MSTAPGSSGPAVRQRPAVVRVVVAFGAFWWDFLVGETPELFVGAVVAIAVVAVVCTDRAARTVAAAVLPVLVVAVLAGSLVRAARSR
ncbi:MAG: hypothetical protein ACP5P9_03540 [Acidimicrobiales bacterium]